MASEKPPLDPQPDDIKPVGVYLADWYGDKIYTIGMAHYQGNEGLTGSPNAKPMPLAPPDNLEARLHVLGKPYLFLNLRSLDTNAAHPLRKPQSMRVVFPTNGKIADITRAFDGIFYIDTATPATPVKKQD